MTRDLNIHCRNIAITPATLDGPIYGLLVTYPEAGLSLLQ